jgi:hypothetical protein
MELLDILVKDKTKYEINSNILLRPFGVYVILDYKKRIAANQD